MATKKKEAIPDEDQETGGTVHLNAKMSRNWDSAGVAVDIHYTVKPGQDPDEAFDKAFAKAQKRLNKAMEAQVEKLL